MPIAVFDIDGTLTDTMDVDVECYEAAILEDLGIQIPEDWAALQEITDSAILASACELQGRPAPERSTELRIASRVAQLLEAALSHSPERFQPIPGATTVFQFLAQAGWDVVMATGAWQPSALVKLDAAGVPHDGIPLATSSDHRARRDIIQHAVAALRPDEYGSVVYVGDGVWDGCAATELGYGFVGVGAGDTTAALEKVGATGVIPDFSDFELLLTTLDLARACEQ